MNNETGVVITGGDFQALAILRSLARKNIPVIVLDSDHCISRYSRFRKKCFKSPPASDRESYVSFLIDLAGREKINGWAIFPNSDETVYVLSRYKDNLEKFYRVPTPRWEVIQYAYIKEKTYRLAAENGIPIPTTRYPQNLRQLLALDLKFPLVIKPSIRDNFYGKVKIKGFRVNNTEELTRTYRRVCSIIDPCEVIIQELIPGGPNHLYSFCPFFKEGRSWASVTAKRSRQHPMDFGHASTFAETVNIPELRGIAEKFLGLIDYYGIAEVEFMKDPRDGVYKLIEVNPRFWGWHSLAIASGVDFPYILFQDMMGNGIEWPQASNSTKWIRLTTDIPTVFLEIMKRNMKLNDYLSSMKGKKAYAVFAADDPLPFIMEIAMIPYLWAKRGF